MRDLRLNASDPALNLTEIQSGLFCATTEEQFAALCRGRSLDYFCVTDCPACTQHTMDGCALRSIRGKDRVLGWSLQLNNAHGIKSIHGLRSLTGVLAGGLHIEGMATLGSLEGMGGLRSIGVSNSGLSIVLQKNPQLTSVLALENAKYAKGSLKISNAQLACAPTGWPASDSNGTEIPGARGKECLRAGQGDNPQALLTAVVLALTIGLIAIVVGTIANDKRRCMKAPALANQERDSDFNSSPSSLQQLNFSSNNPMFERDAK